jgi:BMFP domain-containing protein YqiC
MEERGEPQAKSMGEVYRLQGDIERAKLEEQEKQLLSNMVSGVRTLVSREQLEAVPPQLQAIRERLDMLVKLEALENEFNQQQTVDKSTKDKTTSGIHDIRGLITQGQAEQDAASKKTIGRN